MKLNNKGWGTTQMFILCGGLLLALLIAIYFINVLYGSLGAAVKNKQYIDMQTKLERAAMSYVINNSVWVEDNISIDYEVLKESGYIGELKDGYGNPCTGYVTVTKINGFNQYYAFLKCNNFVSEKY